MKSSAAAILPVANTSALKREREWIRDRGRKKKSERGRRKKEEGRRKKEGRKERRKKGENQPHNCIVKNTKECKVQSS